MSATDLTIAPDVVDRPRDPTPDRGRITPAWWPHVALACVLLAAAGTLRWWQEQRVLAAIARGGESPFPLVGLPTRLGAWRLDDGGELRLDPEVEQVLGCTDYIRRAYVNEETGVRLELLVLYGPATVAHRPDVCYPGSGYVLIDGPRTRTVAVLGGRAAYDALVFAKGEGGIADRQQVIYSLRYGGRWTAEADLKAFGRLPGMYKVQLARRVGAHERLDADTPSEAFLGAMLAEIERCAAGVAPAGGPRTEAPR